MRRAARVAFFWFAALMAWPACAADYTLLTLQYPPYAYESEPSEEAQGLAIDMVREVFSRLGHTVRIQLLPWPRVLWMIEHGEADGFFTTYRLPEREVWADYCREELAPQVVSLYALKSAPVSYSGDLAGLSSRIIGVVTKVSYGKRFDRAVQDGVLAHVVASLDGERNFRQLFAGRVELVASNREGAHYILARLGRQGEVVELKPPLDSVPSYMAFSRRRNLASLRDEVDRTLREMKADGTWRRLLEQER